MLTISDNWEPDWQSEWHWTVFAILAMFFFLFLKSNLLTLAQQTPQEQPRLRTNIIYNFLLIFMLKNMNSPEGRLSKDLTINYFFFKLNFRPSGNFRKCLKSKFVFKFYRGRWQLYMLVPDGHRFKRYHYQQLGCSKYFTISFFKCITTRRDGGLRKFESECWESLIFCKSWKPSLLYKLECAYIDKMTTNHLFTKL